MYSKHVPDEDDEDEGRGGEEPDVKRGKWVDPELLPDNHFSTPTDVRFRPASRDDFLT